MKALAWILLGLLIGAFATVSALNALRPATAFPKGVMALLQHHLGSAREQVSAGRCDAQLAQHVEALAVLSRDIKPAFLPIGEQDELFAQYADQLRAAADTANATALSDCAIATEQLGQVGDGCKACHRDFK
jgi:hypothetical protein